MKCSFIVRRGAAYDSIEDKQTLETVDMSHVKANVRQIIVDEVINRLKAKGFFNTTRQEDALFNVQ